MKRKSHPVKKVDCKDCNRLNCLIHEWYADEYLCMIYNTLCSLKEFDKVESQKRPDGKAL